MLVIDQPARADVILVLDGDSNDLRLQRAVNLLRTGYGKTVLLDGRTDQVQFGRTQAETAEEFIARRHLENVEVCPGRMASTAEEVAVVAPCLLSLHARRILIVTSAYHTRRALAIFRHRLPQYEWSVAAAPDESAYGTDWWRRRTWAKTWLGETERFVWWELVDRWRYGPVSWRSEQKGGDRPRGLGRLSVEAECVAIVISHAISLQSGWTVRAGHRRDSCSPSQRPRCFPAAAP